MKRGPVVGVREGRYVEIPDELLCLYTARVEDRDGTHVIDVPDRELRNGDVEAGGQYRVALLPTDDSTPETDGSAAGNTSTDDREPRDPPVREGDRRTVEIESLGDQGDGIARVERGYVIIVPDTEVGERVKIEITEVKSNFAVGEIVEETFQ